MKNDKKRIIIAIALVLTLAMAVTGCKSDLRLDEENAETVVPDIVINQPAQEEKNMVSVNGSGKVTLEPDLATAMLSVSTRADTALEAQNMNNQLMEAVLASVKANGVAEADITTSYVNLSETYDYSKSPAKIIGYEMSNSITVKVRAIDNVGKIISDAIAAGATGTGGITFGISDTTEAYRKALAAALADAAAKAQALAEAAGATLSAVPVKITESSMSSTPVEARMELAAADTANSSVPVSKGEIEVTATISAEYELIVPQG